MTPQQHTIFQHLRDHLDAELTLHRRLTVLAERKQRLIVAGSIDEFRATLDDEQPALSELGHLRQIRDRLLRAVCAVLGLSSDDLRLSRIIERLGADAWATELVRRRSDLSACIERLRQLNERNLVLIRQGLGYASELLSAVLGSRAGAPATSATGAYDRRALAGYVAPAARGSLIDCAR
jgi:flagellar biosynthesis/type III secretory pathway chaperone